MPTTPLPKHVIEFLHAPRPAVVAVLRKDGSPASAATWFGWRDGQGILTMATGGLRERRLRRDPRLSLTVLGTDWHTSLTLVGRVVWMGPDSDRSVVNGLAHRYTGADYETSEPITTAVFDVVAWHTYGDL